MDDPVDVVIVCRVGRQQRLDRADEFITIQAEWQAESPNRVLHILPVHAPMLL